MLLNKENTRNYYRVMKYSYRRVGQSSGNVMKRTKQSRVHRKTATEDYMQVNETTQYKVMEIRSRTKE
jgi:triphosphoribosyl-dephospho-CoA synthetase